MESLKIREGAFVFLRLDLNVPIKDGQVQDDTRIQSALPTLRWLLERKARVAMVSHLGRPKSGPDPKFSLEPVGQRIAELLGTEVTFLSTLSDTTLFKLHQRTGAQGPVLFENVRFLSGETKNDPDVAHLLVDGYEFYINDAFGAVHRAHSSVAAAAELIPAENRALGFLIRKEIEHLSPIMKNPAAPFTLIMGGAKVSDKVGVMLNLMNQCHNVLVGGAMAYTFLKFRGVDVGLSKFEPDQMQLVEQIFRVAEARKVRLCLPIDHVGAEAFSVHATPQPVGTAQLPSNLMGLDIGPKTVQLYESVIAQSRTILWNGPMGVFEFPSFAKGTLAIAHALARATSATTVVGGGDSIAALNQAGVASKITHVSTGGGASLEYLEGRTLPGLKMHLTAESAN